MSDIAFPYTISTGHRTAEAPTDAHIRQMIELLLFTSPGERVNRPEFGTGVMQLVFAPNSPELASATEFMVQGALQQYLGDVIKPVEVNVTCVDSTLTIRVDYVVLRTQQRHSAQFARNI